MPRVVFTAPAPKTAMTTLEVAVGPDAITWSYGLNTANFPTYGGEVVQILSCFVDDLTIGGSVRSYTELEKIYGFFINYMQVATEGTKGKGSFDTRPVLMWYPERNWTFQLYPKTMPSFKYGRDVVTPQWQLQAAVEEDQGGHEFKSLLLNKATKNFIKSEGIELFGKVTSVEFADPALDPFSGPQPGTKYTKGTLRSQYGELADAYNHILKSYFEGDFSDLKTSYSKPTFLSGDRSGGGQHQTPVPPKGGSKGGPKTGRKERTPANPKRSGKK